MRFWLHSTVKTTALAPSVTLSIVAHAVLIGAAVRGTGINARELAVTIAQKIAYLPPPDRRGSRENVVEHLEYVAIGGGALLPATGEGTVQAQGGPLREPRVGDDVGITTRVQDKSTPDPSPDSVYSVLEVEERAARTAGSAAPAYPPELMKLGTEGRVYIRFVVDSSGRADPTSIEVLHSTHPLFAEAVRSTVPMMRFTPAMVGGRRVRQAVEQNFEFRITQTSSAPVEKTRSRRAP